MHVRWRHHHHPHPSAYTWLLISTVTLFRLHLEAVPDKRQPGKFPELQEEEEEDGVFIIPLL